MCNLPEILFIIFSELGVVKVPLVTQIKPEVQSFLQGCQEACKEEKFGCPVTMEILLQSDEALCYCEFSPPSP